MKREIPKGVYRGIVRQLLEIADHCEGCEFEREARKVLDDAQDIISREG